MAADLAGRLLAAPTLFVFAGVVAAQDGFEAARDQCVACHGENGVSETEGVPSLGGIDEYYALLQLVAFRSGNRPGDTMQALTVDLSDDDLRAAAAWVDGLPRPPAGPGPDPAVAVAAAELASEHRCNICHGAEYLGGHQMPPLRNQRADYLSHALHEYRAELRFGDRAAMVEVAQGLSDEDIEVLVGYLSTLE